MMWIELMRNTGATIRQDCISSFPGELRIAQRHRAGHAHNAENI
jgi:hypothetical protein